MIILLLLFFCNTIAKSEPNITPNKEIDWTFNGPFGIFDRKQLQRGFQVYKEVCSTCHGIGLLRYEKLKAIDFSKQEIKAIALTDEIHNHIDEDGEITTKKASISDYFTQPYPNKKAARSANNGALPPDLSLIVKAKYGGANYLYSLLIGYTNPPKGTTVMDGMYYNAYFDGYQIAMPPPLQNNQVTYSDGTTATVEQMAQDVTAFLAWVAEPESEYRRQLGIKVITYLIFFTILMYYLMRRIWKKTK